MNIAIVVGHDSKRKGAFSPFFNLSEYDFYNKVVSFIPDVNVYRYNPNISSYTKRKKALAREINKSNYDLVIELHFNAFRSSSANGCETLYYFKSIKGKKYAELFSNMIHSYTGIKLRNNGLKPLKSRKDRGFASLVYVVAPVILIEPGFGTNKSDCDKIESPENLACIINDFINKIK